MITESCMSVHSPVGEINQMTYDVNWLPKVFIWGALGASSINAAGKTGPLHVKEWY